MRSDKYGGRELTPEQKRYLEIVEEERRKNQQRSYSDYDEAYEHHLRREKKRHHKKADKRSSRRPDPYEAAYAQAAHGKKKKKKGKARTAIICILLIALCLAGLGVAYFYKLAGNLDMVATDDSEFDIDPRVAKELKDYRCVAVLGSDARKGEGYDGSRTDAIIIARINKKTDKIQLISVMRDSYLQIDDAQGNKKLDKVTHAHAFGGAVNTCKSLNRNLDLNIKEFVLFDWQAVTDLVDAMGGIEVDIQAGELNDLNHYGPETAKNVGKTYTPIYNSGKQTIDGVQAATYCRIRKSSGGDPARGSRMKIVMSALMKKAKHMGVGELNAIAEDVFPEIRTNMSKGSMLKTIAGMPKYEFGKNYAWPKNYYGGMLWGVWYAVPQTLESEVQWLHKKAFKQEDYVLTDTAQEISGLIIDQTGVY